MKKLALILALIIIPCSAFGLEMLSDSTMDSVTGQAGVNIAMDDIQMFLNIEKMAWIDCDGYNSWEGKATCGGNGGAIVLNNFQIDVLNINAITSTMAEGTALNNGIQLMSTTCGNIPLFYNYATSAVGDGCTLAPTGGPVQNLGLNNFYHYRVSASSANNSEFIPHFLTIDVTDELPASTEGFRYWESHAWTAASVDAGTAGAGNAASSIGGVLIGIPTVEIYINSMSFTPMYDGDLASGASTASNDDTAQVSTRNGAALQAATFGTIYMQGITFTTLSGWIEISPK